MLPEIAFLIGLTILILLAVVFKVNAFISLLVSALVIGLVSGMPGEDVIAAITSGFGNIIAKIGIVIILGVLLGKILEDSRGAEKMAKSTIRLVGQKNGPLAMAISGFLISIPVYSDVGYVILSPLTKALANKSKTCLAIVTVALSAGLLSTHVFIPPTPGPIAVVGLLGINMGSMIIWGTFAAFVMTIAGWFYAQFIMPKYMRPIYSEKCAEFEEDDKMPKIFPSVLPLLVPIVLILLYTSSAMLAKNKTSAIYEYIVSLPNQGLINFIYKFVQFIGEAHVAMSLGVVTAILVLGKRLGAKDALKKVVNGSIKDAGPIIFITAAGGSLGAVLEKSGSGEAIANLIVSSGLPFILLPFLISGILKTIQGSGTVAVVTAATLCLPIATEMGANPLLIALAAGSGARLVCHVNDSYFWVFTKMNNFDTKTGLKTLSAANVFMAFGGLLATWIASLVVG